MTIDALTPFDQFKDSLSEFSFTPVCRACGSVAAVLAPKYMERAGVDGFGWFGYLSLTCGRCGYTQNSKLFENKESFIARGTYKHGDTFRLQLDGIE